jgi:hypothetical protein
MPVRGGRINADQVLVMFDASQGVRARGRPVAAKAYSANNLADASFS